MQVRFGDYAQRAVVLWAVVEMQPYCEHAPKYFGRWLYVLDVLLYRPWTVSINFDSIGDGYRYVLMPRHLPVCPALFNGEDSADGKGLGAKYRMNKTHHLFGGCEGTHLGEIKKVSKASCEVWLVDFISS